MRVTTWGRTGRRRVRRGGTRGCGHLRPRKAQGSALAAPARTASTTRSTSVSVVRQLLNAARSACVPWRTVGVTKVSPPAAIASASACTRSHVGRSASVKHTTFSRTGVVRTNSGTCDSRSPRVWMPEASPGARYGAAGSAVRSRRDTSARSAVGRCRCARRPVHGGPCGQPPPPLPPHCPTRYPIASTTPSHKRALASSAAVAVSTASSHRPSSAPHRSATMAIAIGVCSSPSTSMCRAR